MKKTVIICHDPYDRKTWAIAQVDDVCAYLTTQFKTMPQNARIYHNVVAESHDVTPKTKADIQTLQMLEGTIYFVNYGANPLLIAFYVVMAIMAAYSVYTIATMPKPASASAAGSSNNELQGRSNSARLGGRIPDIFGTVRSYPDLISVIYSYYSAADEDREVEETIMAIGRGYYQIHDAKDSDTQAQGISGMDVSIYDPNTSLTGTAMYQVGNKFTSLPLAATKSASINGQSLKKPNDDLITDDATIYFKTGGIIKSTNSDLDFTDYFKVGDGIEITGATYGQGKISLGGAFTAKSDYTLQISADDLSNVATFQILSLVGAVFTYTTEVVNEDGTTITVTHTADLSGDYTIASVAKDGSVYTFTLKTPKQVNYNWNYITDNNLTATATLSDSTLGVTLDETYSISAIQEDQITLANAATINSDWNNLDLIYGGSTQGVASSVTLGIVENKWVGWFTIEDDDATSITVNLYFPQGLYTTTDSGKTRSGWIDAVFQYQMLDANDNPLTAVSEKTWRILKTTKDSFGVTYRISLPQTGRFRFRIAKVAEKDWNRPVNECKVKDVYATHTLSKSRYADVTLVRTKQIATDGALSMKERKFNTLVTRKLKVDGTGALVATRDAGQALINMALDASIGRRTSNEIDVEQIKAEVLKVADYFGSEDATEFNYTFDDASLSFEEMAGMVASSIFCESYRFGNKLRLNFERPQATSVLLFNHRNKVPKSEKRTYTSGIDKDYDGIKLEYTSPDTDERVNYYLKYDSSTDTVTESSTASNALEIKTSGIRNHAIAKTRAWREWNKLRYSNVSCEFDALDESNLLKRNDRILVADNTLTETQDGEVIAQDGLTLTLSQNVDFEDGSTYYCFLQMQDGTVASIQCTAGEYTNQIVLVSAPSQALVTSADRYVKTLYQVVKSTDAEKQAFMLTELAANDSMSNKLTAMNYDARYYEKDHYFI